MSSNIDKKEYSIFFQFSNEVNGINAVMHNSYCRTKDLPFSNDCDKRWKIFDDNNRVVDDESVTFDCKKQNE